MFIPMVVPVRPTSREPKSIRSGDVRSVEVSLLISETKGRPLIASRHVTMQIVHEERRESSRTSRHAHARSPRLARLRSA